MAVSIVRSAVSVVWCVGCISFIIFSVAEGRSLKECGDQKMDIVFLQDSSYSVKPDSFHTAKQFLVSLTRHMPPIGQDLVRVALVRFGSQADVIARLSQSHDVTAVVDAIEGMTLKVGATKTGRALKTVREDVLDERRPEARAIVIVITDGQSQKFRETKKQARSLRAEGVRLVWLYIASASDSDTLEMDRERQEMADQGDTTLEVASFQDLDAEARMKILNASCKEDPVPETTPTTPDTTSPTTTTTTTTPTTTTTTPPSPSTEEEQETSSANEVTFATKQEANAVSSEAQPESSSSSYSTPASDDVKNDDDVTTAPPEQKTLTISEETKERGSPTTDTTTTTTPTTTTVTTTTSSPSTSPSSQSSPTTAEENEEEEEEEKENEMEENSDNNNDNKMSEKGASRGSQESRGRRGGRGLFDNVGNVVGVTVAGFALLAAVTSVCVVYMAWRKKRKDDRQQEAEDV